MSNTKLTEKSRQEFQKELYALLQKWDAVISFDVSDESDTHGLYNETMIIEHKHTEFRYASVSGWSIDANSLATKKDED